MISAFRPELSEGEDLVRTTKRIAKQVMDFLMENPEIAKISILGDLTKPQESDNTMGSVRGFGLRLSGGNMKSYHKHNAFMITAAMQVAFLRKDVLAKTLGIDFHDKVQRDAFIDDLVGRFSIL